MATIQWPAAGAVCDADGSDGRSASHAPNARKSTTPTMGSHAGVVGSDSVGSCGDILDLGACLARKTATGDALRRLDPIDTGSAAGDDPLPVMLRRRM